MGCAAPGIQAHLILIIRCKLEADQFVLVFSHVSGGCPFLEVVRPQCLARTIQAWPTSKPLGKKHRVVEDELFLGYAESGCRLCGALSKHYIVSGVANASFLGSDDVLWVEHDCNRQRMDISWHPSSWSDLTHEQYTGCVHICPADLCTAFYFYMLELSVQLIFLK